MKTVFGIKTSQTRVYLENGHQLPTTVVKILPATVVQIKTMEKDGYQALQLGLGEGKIRQTNKPLRGHFKKAKKEAFLCLREVQPGKETEFKPGDEVKQIDFLTEGDQVAVVGVSKGTGFTGVVKRWHFAGGPKTHGQSDRLRRPGSIGQGTTPGRVYKGKHMAGRAGNYRTMIKNLSVLKVDSEQGLVWVKGLIPGKTGRLVEITKTGEKTRFSPILVADQPLVIEKDKVLSKKETSKEKETPEPGDKSEKKVESNEEKQA